MRKKSREMGADWALEVVLANNEFWDGAANLFIMPLSMQYALFL